jgi:hypothetical protein
MPTESLELPIVLQTDYTAYLFHALPLCVLKVHPEHDAWLYERDVNIYMPSPDLMLYSYQEHGFYGLGSELFYNNSTSFVLRRDICAELKDRLRKGYYAYLLLDEFYLSGKRSYGSEHRVHDSLIYGFDCREKIFLAVTDGAAGGVLQKMKYGFDDVSRAYCGTRNHSARQLAFFKLNREVKAEFSGGRYLKALVEYANGLPSADYIFPCQCHREPPTCHGVNLFATFSCVLAEKERPDFLDFRSAHFLLQHKNNLIRSLQYLVDMRIVPGDFTDMLLRFAQTADGIRRIRSQLLKSLELQRQGSPPRRLEDLRQRTIRALREYGAQERENVIAVTEYLKHHIAVPQGSPQAEPALPECSFERGYQRDLVSAADVKLLADERKQGGYAYHRCFRLSWPVPVTIRRIRFRCRGLSVLSLDRVAVPLSANTFSRDEWEYRVLEWDATCSVLTADVFSDRPVTFGGLDLAVTEGSLTWGKAAAASSVWQGDDGRPAYAHVPENALTYCTGRFWNAQRSFPGREYLEADLGAETQVDRVVVRERPDAARIRRYVVDAYDGSGAVTRVAEHAGSMEGRPAIHDFPRMKAGRLRLTVLETAACRHGVTGPGVASFEAYCFPYGQSPAT